MHHVGNPVSVDDVIGNVPRFDGQTVQVQMPLQLTRQYNPQESFCQSFRLEGSGEELIVIQRSEFRRGFRLVRWVHSLLIHSRILIETAQKSKRRIMHVGATIRDKLPTRYALNNPLPVPRNPTLLYQSPPCMIPVPMLNILPLG